MGVLVAQGGAVCGALPEDIRGKINEELKDPDPGPSPLTGEILVGLWLVHRVPVSVLSPWCWLRSHPWASAVSHRRADSHFPIPGSLREAICGLDEAILPSGWAGMSVPSHCRDLLGWLLLEDAVGFPQPPCGDRQVFLG